MRCMNFLTSCLTLSPPCAPTHSHKGDNMDIEKIRAETPGVKHSTHLLACGAGLMPQPVVDAVVGHTMLEAQIGGYEAEKARSDALNGVYDLVARLIGAKPCEIALQENATVAWRHAFYALPLQAGDRILTCEAEYSANYVAFLQRQKRDGIIIDVIPSDAAGALDLAALEAMMRAALKTGKTPMPCGQVWGWQPAMRWGSGWKSSKHGLGDWQPNCGRWWRRFRGQCCAISAMINVLSRVSPLTGWTLKKLSLRWQSKVLSSEPQPPKARCWTGWRGDCPY